MTIEGGDGCLGSRLSGKWWRDRTIHPDLACTYLEHELSVHGNATATAKAHEPLRLSQVHNAMQDMHIKSPAGDGRPVLNQPKVEEIDVDVDKLSDIDGMLRDRGLEPDDWTVIRAVVNQWQGFLKDDNGNPVTVPLKQLKVYLRRRLSLGLLSPAAVKLLPKPATRKAVKRDCELFFIYGDDQRPNVDRGFERLKLRWIAANQPDVILDLGDGMDMPQLSGHKTNPAMNWSVQQCADDYASWLYAARCAAPNAAMIVLPDNHLTGRLRDYQLARAAAMYGVRPADVQGLDPDLSPLWSVERLLRLDEIGVRYVQPPGDTHYAEGQHEIIPGELVALHGYRTGANLGRKLIDDYGCSIIYGHAHGQDVYVTDQKRRGVGDRKRLYAIGVGCGANIHGGGGFAPGADWQNCALTVSVFPDGGWTFDYLNYEDGTLRWRDQAYTLEEAA